MEYLLMSIETIGDFTTRKRGALELGKSRDCNHRKAAKAASDTFQGLERTSPDLIIEVSKEKRLYGADIYTHRDRQTPYRKGGYGNHDLAIREVSVKLSSGYEVIGYDLFAKIDDEHSEVYAHLDAPETGKRQFIQYPDIQGEDRDNDYFLNISDAEVVRAIAAIAYSLSDI